MYVYLTRVNTGEQPIENATIVAEEMLPWLREIDGFEGLLMLCRKGTTVTLTFWESREAAERRRVPRLRFIERITAVADVQVEEMLDFEVAFSHLRPPVTETTLARDR